MIKLFAVLWVLYSFNVFAKEGTPNLSLQTAELRASLIAEVKYEWNVHLLKGDEFRAETQIYFRMLRPETVPLDFFAGEIEDIKVNGADATSKYDGKTITLEKDLLVKGTNVVQVTYKRKYNKNGTGLTKVVDPKDQKTYLYTQFQTMDANQVIPCFDQPDIKAKFLMKVTAPKNWSVITSVKEEKIRYNKNKERVWIFPESETFSTYLLSLHAGPYRVWKSKTGKIPLRLFARRSMAEFVPYKEWFNVTNSGFKYFENYFGVKYPYKKYDQIIVPEFNAGAMENVAAVTFNERMLSRGHRQRHQKRSLANVILHEMAHMWFGNLVTMKWWDDLWLNESFATFLAHKSLEEATEYKEAWKSFYGRTKKWAYFEDKLVTTHPIVADVQDVHKATVNFDGITYGKGASVLKQLEYYVGETKFRSGVRNYIKKYSEQNTVAAQFVEEIGLAAGRDLKPWMKAWVETSGVNRIKVDKFCSGEGRLEKLTFNQIKDGSSEVLRPHKFKVGFLNKSKSGLKLVKSFDVELTKENIDMEFKGKEGCPELIALNVDDYGYFDSVLDQGTVASLRDNIDGIDSGFLREMYWNTLWEMVRDADLDVLTYADLVLEKGLKEADDDLLASITGNIFEYHNGRASIERYLQGEDKEQNSLKSQYLEKFEGAILEQLNESKAGSDRQMMFFRTYISAVRSKKGLIRLKDYLIGSVKLKGLKIDQDLRWSILQKLKSYDFSNVEQLIAVEKKRDSSTRAKLAALSIDASTPKWEAKQKVLDSVVKGEGFSLSETRAVLGSLFPVNQRPLKEKLDKVFYKKLAELIPEKDVHFLSTFSWLRPLECEIKDKSLTKQFLESNKSLHPRLIKNFKVAAQEDSRCAKVVTKTKSAVLQRQSPK